MRSLLFDTCFLIDLERERRKGLGKAHHFLQTQSDARPCLSWTILQKFRDLWKRGT